MLRLAGGDRRVFCERSRLNCAGTPLHIYYVFFSRLLASCSVRAASRREAMTKRYELAAELFYSVGSTTGDLCLFCSVDISFKLQFTDL
ncbi:MAG: hypothetical protein ACYT04_44020 [Nostoc sp.]